jgi:hypothetical protein
MNSLPINILVTLTFTIALVDLLKPVLAKFRNGQTYGKIIVRAAAVLLAFLITFTQEFFMGTTPGFTWKAVGEASVQAVLTALSAFGFNSLRPKDSLALSVVSQFLKTEETQSGDGTGSNTPTTNTKTEQSVTSVASSGGSPSPAETIAAVTSASVGASSALENRIAAIENHIGIATAGFVGSGPDVPSVLTVKKEEIPL